MALRGVMRTCCWFWILGVLLSPLSGAETGPLAEGKDRFTLEARGKTLEVFTYKPKAYPGERLFVVMHGVNRNADEYRDNAVALGDRFGALIVAPRFDLEQFPVEAYQRGGVTHEGKAQAMERWTFAFISEVVAATRQREGRPELPYHLIGHSAGGQFLTRLAAFLPGEAVRIVAGNPGSLIFPTREMPFQYGFGGLPEKWSDDAWLKRYLAAPLTLFLGTEDTGDKHLDESELAMKQGKNRWERGRACFEMGKQLAEQKGWPFNWTLVVAEGVGHDSARLFAHPKAEEAIFGGDDAR